MAATSSILRGCTACHCSASRESSPSVHPSAFIAPTAVLIGDVTVEENASVWYNAVLRGDFSPIVIRRGANVQDGSVIHVTPGAGTEIGAGATIGHLCVIHAATHRRGSAGRQWRHRPRRRARGRARHGGSGGAGHAGHRDSRRDARGRLSRQGAGPGGGHAGRALGEASTQRPTRPSPSATRQASSRSEQGCHGHHPVTGFEPFADDAANPSQEIAKVRRWPSGGGLRGAGHRPSRRAHGRARADRPSRCVDPELVGVVHVGLAGGRARIALEQVAVNVDGLLDTRREGSAMCRRAMRGMGGPAAYLSTLPNRAILTALTADGVPGVSLLHGGDVPLQPDALLDTPRDRAARPGRARGVHPRALPALDGRCPRPRRAEHGAVDDESARRRSSCGWWPQR